LWTALSKAGVPRYAPLVTVADDPGEAAALWIVLRLMGYADVKVMLP
jgi:thiosulfate/3-mercaptopyruvate sulfurtransferase